MQQDKQLIEKYSVIIAEFMGVNVLNLELFTCEDACIMIEKGSSDNHVLRVETFNYHTDWNEIYKVVKKLVNVDTSSFTFEQFDYICDRINLVQYYFISHSDEHTSYDAFISIGEAIEYLNTIKQITQ